MKVLVIHKCGHRRYYSCKDDVPSHECCIQCFLQITDAAIDAGIVRDKSYNTVRYGLVSSFSGSGTVAFGGRNWRVTSKNHYLDVREVREETK